MRERERERESIMREYGEVIATKSPLSLSLRRLHVCPHTAIYVSSHCCICVLLLLYMCPHTAIYVSSYCCMCPHTAIYVSSYCCMCPHTVPRSDRNEIASVHLRLHPLPHSCTTVHTHTHTHIHTHTHAYVYLYMYMYVYIYMYIDIYITHNNIYIYHILHTNIFF